MDRIRGLATGAAADGNPETETRAALRAALAERDRRAAAVQTARERTDRARDLVDAAEAAARAVAVAEAAERAAAQAWAASGAPEDRRPDPLLKTRAAAARDEAEQARVLAAGAGDALAGLERAEREAGRALDTAQREAARAADSVIRAMLAPQFDRLEAARSEFHRASAEIFAAVNELGDTSLLAEVAGMLPAPPPALADLRRAIEHWPEGLPAPENLPVGRPAAGWWAIRERLLRDAEAR